MSETDVPYGARSGRQRRWVFGVAPDSAGRDETSVKDRAAAVLHEVGDFARRRPGVFLAVAAGAGLVVGQFVRGAKDASDDGTARLSGTGSATAGVPAGHTPPTLPPTVPDGVRPQTIGGGTDVGHP